MEIFCDLNALLKIGIARCEGIIEGVRHSKSGPRTTRVLI